MISLPVINKYLKLFRISHWIKNILIFIPFFFSLGFLNIQNIIISIFGFFCFSLLSSIIYILNDIQDIEKDRLHSTKRFRPLAAGKISKHNAIITIILLTFILVSLLVFWYLKECRLSRLSAVGILLLYALLNIGYSYGLKNIPIVDVTILAAGFVIRIIFGATIIEVDISVWLYLTILMGAYYLGFGKRRNEIIKNEKNTRLVMNIYTHNFLDKNMYMCQTLCLIFYSLWSIDSVTIDRFNTSAFIYTIPLILIILLKYNLNIESDSDGDPTSIILHDKILMLLCLVYIVCAFCLIYLNKTII
jgi:4-hydroxybenzoate polyprenyltransferase